MTCLICSECGDFTGLCSTHKQEWVESGEFRRGPPAPTHVALADFVRRRQAERLNAGNSKGLGGK